MDPFNTYLELPSEELYWEMDLSRAPRVEFQEFLINPRRLRGSDFLMRWAQGRWSEEIVIHALEQTAEFGVIPDGTASAPKKIVKVPYFICREFGGVSGPSLLPRTFVDRNGKVMTYVTFSGGSIQLAPDVFEVFGAQQ